jgi:hypothetical protein
MLPVHRISADRWLLTYLLLALNGSAVVAGTPGTMPLFLAISADLAYLTP